MYTKKIYVFIVLLSIVALAGLLFTRLGPKPKKEYNANIQKSSTMKLASTSFENQKQIPSQYTCDGENINPELHISGVPDGTGSLVLIMDDPDATGGRTWDHWVVWNIDPKTAVILENSVPQDAVPGRTSFGDQKYGGPCPPRGSKPHRYMFKLYALDIALNISADSDKKTVEGAMKGHIIDQAMVIGLFNH